VSNMKNTSIITHEDVKEITIAFYRKQKSTMVCNIMGSFVFLWGLSSLIPGLINNDMKEIVFGVSLIFFLPILLNIIIFLIDNHRVKHFYKCQLIIPGSQECLVDIELADEIKIILNGKTNGVSSFDYSQVQKIIETKNMFVILLKRKMFLLLKKSGFVDCSCEEFKTFMNKKATSVLI
jgi:hypothetical protein